MKYIISIRLMPQVKLALDVILISIIIIFMSGCASTSKQETVGIPQIITVEKELKVHLYDSVTSLRTAYMYNGGDADKIKRVLGFYSERDNTIHCLKWDFYTCGHELFHVLQYKGDSPLLVEKGYEHFKEHNYASE
jgi:hypothetical protein